MTAAGDENRPRRNRGTKTSPQEIARYWSVYSEEHDISVDWYWSESIELGLSVCWRCGHKTTGLEKCHIIPHSLGGEDTPSNLLLMCQRCHFEAPNCDDPDFMLTWLVSDRELFPNIYWYLRGLKEFERLFGRPFLSDLDEEFLKQYCEECPDLFDEIKKHGKSEQERYKALVNKDVFTSANFCLPQNLNSVLRKLITKRTVHHFGTNGANASTVAWVLRQVEKELERLQKKARRQKAVSDNEPENSKQHLLFDE